LSTHWKVDVKNTREHRCMGGGRVGLIVEDGDGLAASSDISSVR